MINEEIQELLSELEEDAGRLQALEHRIKMDIILKNLDRAKQGLETSSFLSDKIGANSFLRPPRAHLIVPEFLR